MPSNTPAVVINPSATNPPVALANGVLQNGNGQGGTFYLDLGQSAFTSAAMTTVITGSPSTVTVQLQGSMDGNTWNNLASSAVTTNDTQFAASGNQFSALRVNVLNVTGGTNPTISVAISAFMNAANGSGGVVVTSIPQLPTGSAPNGTVTSGTVTSTGTLFSIAANSFWYGTISLVSSVASAGAASTILVSTPNTAGVLPLNTNFANLAVAASPASGAGNTGSINVGPLWIRNNSNGSINITATITGGTNPSAAANGIQYPQ